MSRNNSPLKRQASSLSMNSTSMIGESRNRQLQRKEIQLLVNKFNDLNGQIEIEADQTNFNLVQYERENDKIKYDPQMMTAKLRKLQNRAEINRAQMEIDNRLKKKMKNLKSQGKREDQSYSTIYNKYIKNRKISDEIEEPSDEESHTHEGDSKTVAFFSQLKRHPRILEYTLSKIQKKSREIESKDELKKQQIEDHKNSKVEISKDYQQLLEEVVKKNNQNEEYNPQTVIDQQFSKFFNKKSSDSLNKQIMKSPRCNKMIERQNKILSQIDDKSLSKQNKKKLKNRLNEIIFSIGKSQKVSSKTGGGFPEKDSLGKTVGFALPKIFTNREMDRKAQK